MTPAERDAQVRRDRAEKRAREQAEADRKAAVEQAARDRVRANAVAAQALLAEIGPRVAEIVPLLARLQQLIPDATLRSRICDALVDAGVSLDIFGPLSVLGSALSPLPEAGPSFRIPVQIG